MAQTTSD